MGRKRGFLVGSWLGVILLGAGCTRALEVSYNADVQRLTQADALAGIPVGVAKFEDKRAWVDQSDPRTLSYVGQAGPWRLGMDYKGKEYVPVRDVVQDVLVESFNKAGLSAKTIEQILAKKDGPAFRQVGEQGGFRYVLGGEILVFEWANEKGVFTVTSRRAVTLQLLMVRVSDENPVLDMVVNDSERQDEGLGVLHSTNQDRLMNTVFKQVVQKVITEVAAKLALHPRDVHITVASAPR